MIYVCEIMVIRVHHGELLAVVGHGYTIEQTQKPYMILDPQGEILSHIKSAVASCVWVTSPDHLCSQSNPLVI